MLIDCSSGPCSLLPEFNSAPAGDCFASFSLFDRDSIHFCVLFSLVHNNNKIIRAENKGSKLWSTRKPLSQLIDSVQVAPRQVVLHHFHGEQNFGEHVSFYLINRRHSFACWLARQPVSTMHSCNALPVLPIHCDASHCYSSLNLERYNLIVFCNIAVCMKAGLR